MPTSIMVLEVLVLDDRAILQLLEGALLASFYIIVAMDIG